ncbi:MAG TPA: dienelactone hydrolase family protein, partial [Terricaulis sp.]|nr:dienelactone hydrolase family protein [Terricaulis sp.]
SGLPSRPVPLEAADYVLCTGLFDDETETAEDYRPSLDVMLARGTELICANPDIVVERGHRLIPCAGAIADLYERMGGAVTWMAAARFAQIKAGVAWYGRLTPPAAGGFGAEADRPWPVNVAADLKAPVLGLYAENDNGIPLSTVEEMRAALAAAGNPTGSEIIVYPGAQHGFHADYRASYDAVAAADGWARCLAWFRANGVG